jgi:Ca2+-binding EF-hand superfamily protein|uniref:EF-hand domain-containing protein n=1 Tax=Eutreptiella gymnastica TaxID=73025 RepID=A0A7S4LCC0_9EUGL|eukprot:CAMPEP_0174286224 /NCGR_PEP_ID=MMETSP0809-20121228/10942_1 /TAXON_ID=73025 ORGANISM="Eutreptiella gymnastica-like, Strain CCMP1594" /NCGR_SAMPLE_ID=MMETSP0809 /ASSEMBLY_ACC=CAM_ASM_000658 /LENGTH=455 /DNA_ID=CAMNT_0015382203 /DNA_START=19 /DNA_END=1386 /DNA_ORIENTATION=-
MAVDATSIEFKTAYGSFSGNTTPAPRTSSLDSTGMTLLFSYPGSPPSLTAAKEISQLSNDDIKGWRWLYDHVGAEQATKQSIEGKLKGYVGPFDWDDVDSTKPLDFGAFLTKMNALQTGQRIVLLQWAHATSKGNQVRANPNSVMMTRPKYNPADYAITPAYRMAEIKASEAKSQIERNRAYNDAQAKATVAQRQLAAKVAEIERYNAQAQRNAQNAQASYMAASAAAATPEHRIIHSSGYTVSGASSYTSAASVMTSDGTVSAEDVAAWWKLFNFCDQDGSGSISKAEINVKMSPMVGKFEWDDENADGLMEFDEFVQCMNDLPVSKKFTCLRWAREYCPDHTGGRPAPKVGPMHAPAPYHGDPSALPAHPAGNSEEDMRAWRKLYNFIDADRSGVISKREINEKMSPMVGGFEWDDADADGQMEFDEFVQTMNTLPPSKHFTCLLWAKTQCPG